MGRTRRTELELTERQREVLRLVARGHTNTEIAEALGLSLAGAKWHVSELLVKFSVESREDLAERWAMEHRVGPRVSRWWAGLVGAMPLKPSMTVAVGALAVLGAGIGATVGLALMYDSDTGANEVLVVQAATPSPTPTPTVVPTATLPAAPGAIWTAQEALAKAEAEARKILQGDANVRITPGQFELRLAEWLPQATAVEARDPDRNFHWLADGGTPVSVWRFGWVIPNSTILGNFPPGPTEITMQVLVADGEAGEAVANWRDYGKAPGADGLIGGAGGFRSRYSEALHEQWLHDRSQVGEPIRFGLYNDLTGGGAWIETYPAGGGYWCVRGKDTVGGGNGDWCSADDDPRRDALSSNLSTTFSASGVMGDAVLWIDTTAEVVKLRALPGDGRVLEFQTYAPPPESGISRRFAWINLGQVAGDYRVIGLDAAGLEIATAAGTVPGPPPPHP